MLLTADETGTIDVAELLIICVAYQPLLSQKKLLTEYSAGFSATAAK